MQKNYLLFLFLITVLSYGQLLGMYVWQDDNALFFKLAHISETAGYLSAGPFGEGVYKYIHTPYIPLYNIFGFNTVPYFAFNLALYFLTTIVVYKVFSFILNKTAGKLIGFLYAAGYIASDGIIRLFNSVATSISIILTSLLLFFYWKYFKVRDAKWYILALVTFFLVTEFARGRTHYLIAVVIVFELLFLTFEKPFRSLIHSFVRLAPFALVFYNYYVVGADARSGQVKNLIVNLGHGELYQTYSFVTSFANIVLPDWLTNNLINFWNNLPKINSLNILSWLILVSSILITFQLVKKQPRRNLILAIFSVLIIVWKLIVGDIYSSPVLNLGESQIFIAFLGGVLFLLTAIVFIILKGINQKLYVLFFSWIVLNISAYAAYNPTYGHESINRYLAHSLFALVGILGILYLTPKNVFWKKITLFLILLWGFGNVTFSLIYQNNVLSSRSEPSREFYNQLKAYVPNIERGDVFYFDVADDAQDYFRDAFSVASMPEETAIAWRYGVDRYNIRRIVNFEDLVKLINLGSFTDKEKNQVPLRNIYTFFYSSKGLVDTTGDTINFLKNGGRKELVFSGKTQGKDEIVVDLEKSINSTVETEVNFTFSAKFQDPESIEFPYLKNPNMANNEVAKSEENRKLAFLYRGAKTDFYNKSSIETNNEWQNNLPQNAIDNNPNTFWRADRIKWHNDNAVLTLDLKKNTNVNRFVWVNSFSGSTPTEYKIQTSIDAISWQDVKTVVRARRANINDLQVVDFPQRTARYVRMIITKTLNNDSPSIAEVWTVPVEFSRLDVKDMESFLSEPFGYIPNLTSFESTLSDLGMRGFVQVYWKGDKFPSWATDVGKRFNAIYDGVQKQYKIVLPAGGTKIDRLRFMISEIPGVINITDVKYRQLSAEEVLKSK